MILDWEEVQQVAREVIKRRYDLEEGDVGGVEAIATLIDEKWAVRLAVDTTLKPEPGKSGGPYR